MDRTESYNWTYTPVFFNSNAAVNQALIDAGYYDKTDDIENLPTPGLKYVIDPLVFQNLVNDYFSQVYDFFRPDISNFPRDPLVLDLNGDGIALSDARGGKSYFDIDNDGFREQVGWIDASDGLLVRDLNNNGTIDTINELIGTDTQDAYTVLDELDLNGDGTINASDAVWNSLKVWQDANGDGLTQAGERERIVIASECDERGNLVLATQDISEIATSLRLLAMTASPANDNHITPYKNNKKVKNVA